MIGSELLAAVSAADSAFSNVWVAMIVKTAAVLAFFLMAPLFVGYMEHKALAHMQSRLGPMEAGGFHGWAQLIADAVKFLQKEQITPAAADRWVFTLAPGVVMIPYIAIFIVIPLGDTVFATNLDAGIFFVLAASGISIIGVLMAGWASANKFSLIGALRAAAQLIAYELPLILAAAAVVMQAGSLSLVDIVEAQQGLWFIFTQPVGFAIFMVAALAELTRSPFDMPVADSEIIFGAYTEYTGIRLAFFLLAEYAGIVAMSAIAAVMFLGGYLAGPVPGPEWLVGIAATILKTFALAFLIIWFKGTYPRLREDQLQRFAWVFLIPLALLNIMLTAIFKVVI